MGLEAVTDRGRLRAFRISAGWGTENAPVQRWAVGARDISATAGPGIGGTASRDPKSGGSSESITFVASTISVVVSSSSRSRPLVGGEVTSSFCFHQQHARDGEMFDRFAQVTLCQPPCR